MGSSKNMSGGLLTSSKAIASLFLCPLVRVAVLVRRHSNSPIISSMSSIYNIQHRTVTIYCPNTRSLDNKMLVPMNLCHFKCITENMAINPDKLSYYIIIAWSWLKIKHPTEWTWSYLTIWISHLNKGKFKKLNCMPNSPHTKHSSCSRWIIIIESFISHMKLNCYIVYTVFILVHIIVFLLVSYEIDSSFELDEDFPRISK